jgi:hypothetical protein
MASLIRLVSGNWRVQLRSKNRYVSETFRRRKDGSAVLTAEGDRDRRPAQDDLDELIEYFETNGGQFIPMSHRMVRGGDHDATRGDRPSWLA